MVSRKTTAQHLQDSERVKNRNVETMRNRRSVTFDIGALLSIPISECVFGTTIHDLSEESRGANPLAAHIFVSLAIASRPVIHDTELFAVVQELALRHSYLGNTCRGWRSLDLHRSEEISSRLAMDSDH